MASRSCSFTPVLDLWLVNKIKPLVLTKNLAHLIFCVANLYELCHLN